MYVTLVKHSEIKFKMKDETYTGKVAETTEELKKPKVTAKAENKKKVEDKE